MDAPLKIYHPKDNSTFLPKYIKIYYKDYNGKNGLSNTLKNFRAFFHTKYM